MKIYVISDLHLCLGKNKPMDVFGGGWEGYMDKLQYNWRKKVGKKDYVLVPGDISWATYLNDAKLDFDYIEKLPGKKILLKGNHDYWWSTNAKLDKFVKENSYKSIVFIKNNSYIAGKMVICGTRGWMVQYGTCSEEKDLKIYNREIERLKLSLKSAKKTGLPTIVMLHYPPFKNGKINKDYSDLMKEYNVKICVYGHLHSKALKKAIEGKIDGILYKCVSADYLKFIPYRLKTMHRGILDIIRNS